MCQNQPLLKGTVDVVPHKRIHGGGVRLRMLAALVQDGRGMCPGYAAIEYVTIRCDVAVLVISIRAADVRHDGARWHRGVNGL